MSRYALFAVLGSLLIVFLAVGCQKSSTMETDSTADAQSQIESKPAVPTSGGTETVVLHVYGMSCPLCATNVDKQLLKVSGVQSVNVNLNTGRVLVQVDRNNRPEQESLERAVTESGFTLVDEPTHE